MSTEQRWVLGLASVAAAILAAVFAGRGSLASEPASTHGFTAAIGAASALALLGGLRRSQWSPTLGVTALPLDVLPRGDSIELLRRYRPDLAANDPAWTPSFMSRATCRWLCTSRAVTCARIAPR